jgi:hypothetical protein
MFDDKAKVINGILQEGTLLWLEEEFIILAFGKDPMETGFIFGDSVSGNQEIIHIYVKPSFIDLLSEDIVHHGLECGWWIAKTKEHDQWFKTTAISDEGGFPFVALFDPNIIVSPMDVKLREDLGIFDLVNKFRD